MDNNISNINSISSNNSKNNKNNIDLLNFFIPVMSETLHLLGQNLDIETIKSKLYQLVEQKQVELNLTIFDAYQSQDKNADANVNDKNIQLIKKAQFAVFAWVDEKILTSELNDALKWSNYALQNTYFKTSEAGYLFYKNLDDILNDFFDISNTIITDINTDINTNNSDNDDNTQQLINEKLEKFAEQLAHINNNHNTVLFETMKIYSLCILYGFLGQYHNDNAMLKSLRNNAYYILHHNTNKNVNALMSNGENFYFLLQQQSSYKQNFTNSFHENIISKNYLEIVLYIIIPIILCIIFTTFSANLLIQSPFAL